MNIGAGRTGGGEFSTGKTDDGRAIDVYTANLPSPISPGIGLALVSQETTTLIKTVWSGDNMLAQ